MDSFLTLLTQTLENAHPNMKVAPAARIPVGPGRIRFDTSTVDLRSAAAGTPLAVPSGTEVRNEADHGHRAGAALRGYGRDGRTPERPKARHDAGLGRVDRARRRDGTEGEQAGACPPR